MKRKGGGLLSPALLIATLVAMLLPITLPASQRQTDDPWRTLVLVYESTDIATPDKPTEALRLSAMFVPKIFGDLITFRPADDWSPRFSVAAHAHLADSLGRMPGIITDWSNDRAHMTIETIYTAVPLRQTSYYGRLGAVVTANNVRAELERYAPPGKYDSIFIIWRNLGAEGRVITGHAGVAFPVLDGGTGAYIASIPLKPWFDETIDLRGLREVFVHEWLHQVIAENRMQGATNLAELHDSLAYGYVQGTAAVWYSDMLSGALTERFGVTPLNFVPPADARQVARP